MQRRITSPWNPAAPVGYGKNTQEVFIVGSITHEGNLSFSNNPYKHGTEPAARAEVERLSRLFPGKTFVYFKQMGRCKTETTSWF